MTKWICTVCGHIHEGDGPPDTCPVCGNPSEVSVPLEKVSESRKSGTPYPEMESSADLVVVGSGAAGLSAAVTAKEMVARSRISPTSSTSGS